MVQTKLKHPEYLAVSANVVNHPLMSWIHYHIGAIRPYLPELEPPKNSTPSNSWRASKLPRWSGPENFTISDKEEFKPPFKGHRWLPLGGDNNTDGTPIAMAEYHSFGKGWYRWEIAAQVHYSLLENLEKDPQLNMYKFNLWDTIYDRVSINCIAFMGDDILDNGPMPASDEEYLSQILPKKLGRRTCCPFDFLTPQSS